MYLQTIKKYGNRQKKHFLKIVLCLRLEGQDPELQPGSGSISQRHGSHGSVPKCHGSATLVSNLPSQSNYASLFSNCVLFCLGGWPAERQGRFAKWEPRFGQWEREFPRLQTWSGGSPPAAGQTGQTSSLFNIPVPVSREYWMIGGPGFLVSSPTPCPPPPSVSKLSLYSWIFLFMFVIQHCFICRPSDSIMSEDAGIEPRTIVT